MEAVVVNVDKAVAHLHQDGGHARPGEPESRGHADDAAADDHGIGRFLVEVRPVSVSFSSSHPL
jgi:hypothetical protein